MARIRRRRLSDCSSYSSDCDFSPPPPSPSNFYPSSSPLPATFHSPAKQPSPSYSSPPLHLPTISKTLHSSSKTITLIVVLFLCALVFAFLFLTYLTVRKQRNSRTRTRTTVARRSRPAPNEDSEIPPTLDLDLLHDNHGDPVLDHPIWYIRTVGLQQSVIESIAIFKYKRGVIEGTDCSVCLSEFEEDESLRLLPKCSHAFHIHCIDTWLSSHQNCPLCRAPIVSATEDVPNCSTVITVTEQDQLDDSSAVHPDPESLINSHSQRIDHLFHEVNMRLDQFSDEDEDRVSGVSVDKNPRQGRNSGTRVLSDLGDHHRSVLKEEEEEGVGRRSVSMDASSAAHLTSSFLAMVKADHGEGCSSNEPAAELKNGKKKKKMKSSSLMMDGIEEGDKSITSRVTKTYSFGRFLQRSTSSASASSSGGFFSLSSSRH